MKAKLTDEARKSALAKLSGWSEVASSDVASRVSETPYAVSVRTCFARIVVHRSARRLSFGALARSNAMPGSMIWSHTALPLYLHGVGVEIRYAEDGSRYGVENKLRDHVVGDKVVPTDFFGQADARHISTVLFSNAGTMAKFEESATQKERIVLSGWNYFVQSFNAGKGGNLKADAPIACKSATGALRTAERLVSSPSPPIEARPAPGVARPAKPRPPLVLTPPVVNPPQSAF